MIVALLVVGSAFAVAAGEDKKSARSRGILTVFEGLVMIDGQPAADHKVIIMCEHDYNGNNKTKMIKNTFTDENGHYLATHMNWNPGKQCVVGDTAFIIVKNGKDKIVSEEVVVVEEDFHGTTYGYADISVGVPEFSTTTAAVAVIGVTLGIVALRRRD